MTQQKIYGIIAGSGLLPSAIVAACTSQGYKCFIAIIANQDSSDHYREFDYQYFGIGQVGGIVNYFKDNDVTNIIMVGKVERPDFKVLDTDMQGAKLLMKLAASRITGDDNVMRKIASFFEGHGFIVSSPAEVAPQLVLEPGCLTIKDTNTQYNKDIELGYNVIQALSKYDIGQSVIVAKGRVIGIEAAEGTDRLIQRCKLYQVSNTSAILIKATKKDQDQRLDIPVIGLRTIELAAENYITGIAIQAGRVIVIEKEACIKKANELGIFLVAF